MKAEVLIQIVRASSHQVVHEERMCKTCWEKLKGQLGYENDGVYHVRVLPITNYDTECNECAQDIP